MQSSILRRSEPTTVSASADTPASKYRPNPLWAVNGAMAAFFILAAVVLASD